MDMGTEISTDELRELINENESIKVVSGYSRDALAATAILIKVLIRNNTRFEVSFDEFETSDADISIARSGSTIKANQKTVSQKMYTLAMDLDNENSDLGYLVGIGSYEALNRDDFRRLADEIEEKVSKIDIIKNIDLYGKHGSLFDIITHPLNPRFPGLTRERAVNRFLEKRELDPSKDFFDLEDGIKSEFNSALVMYLMQNEQKKIAQNLVGKNMVMKNFDPNDFRHYVSDYGLAVDSISSDYPGKAIGFLLGEKIKVNLNDFLEDLSGNLKNSEDYIECSTDICYPGAISMAKDKEFGISVSYNKNEALVIGVSSSSNVRKEFSGNCDRSWGTSKIAKAFINKDEVEDFIDSVV